MSGVEFDVDLEDPDFIETLEEGDSRAVSTIYLEVDGTPLMGPEHNARRKEFVILYFNLLLRSILSADDELVAPFKYAPGRLKAEKFDKETISLSVTDRGKPQNRDLTNGLEASKEGFIRAVLEEAKELINTIQEVNPDMMEKPSIQNVREHIRKLE